MNKRYSFDDLNVGLLSESGTHVVTPLVPRPLNVPLSEWYKIASAFCELLNNEKQELTMTDVIEAHRLYVINQNGKNLTNKEDKLYGDVRSKLDELAGVKLDWE